jgi:hypothetical protein
MEALTGGKAAALWERWNNDVESGVLSEPWSRPLSPVLTLMCV